MGLSRRTSAKRWIAALGVSLSVHFVLLAVMMVGQAPTRLVEMPAVEIAIAVPPRPDERPKTIQRPPQAIPETPSPPAPRPAEIPPQVIPLPIPALPKISPPPSAPAAPAEVAGGFRLGCEGRPYESLSPEEQRRCVRSLSTAQRTYSPGEQKAAVPPNARQKQFAAEAAANAQRSAPLGTVPNKTMGCLEASLGVGCTEDRMVPIIKQKF